MLALVLAGFPFILSNIFVLDARADGAPAFNASEDAFVKSTTPTTNFGTAPDLEVQNDTRVMRSLIRFTVSGLPAGAIITGVTLRLFVPANGSVTGGDIWQVSGAWNETTVTWATAPAIGAKLGSMPNPAKTAAWSQAAIPTSYVTGNGTFDFYLTTTNATDAVYYASNNSATPPGLVVTWVSPSATPTSLVPPIPPTVTPTPTLAPVLPPTDTPTATSAPVILPTDTPTATSAIVLPPTNTPTATLVQVIPPTSTPTVTATLTATSSPSSSDPVIAAAGDIACDPASSSFRGGLGSTSSCHMLQTASLITAIKPGSVVTLGDTQYYCGSLAAFNQSYDLSWGQFKPITHPSVGNHEYLTSGGTGCDASNAGAAGYFNYFGTQAGLPSQGYYSYDLGTWHVVVLNSNCSQAGGCNSSSPQYKWLAQDLLTHPNQCTLAYWHIPLYSSGGRANANTKSLYQLLYDKNADLILTGHDHTYERFAPQDALGNLDTVRGIREFVVGSGGANHTSLVSRAANSEVFNQDTFGVLKVTLHPNSFDWVFVPEAGKTFTDSGTTLCH
ncbi:MAG TPA: DNRLRE domain-containing protein [Anaerolineales bacterium]